MYTRHDISAERAFLVNVTAAALSTCRSLCQYPFSAPMLQMALSRRLYAIGACCKHRHSALATTSTSQPHRDDETEPPVHDDPHWGPLDVTDEPPEVIIVEEQHGQVEPPSQKPPMWFIQVHSNHASKHRRHQLLTVVCRKSRYA